ncbi:hypothetical protein CEP52_015836 [Fusarium oligoseptatum]|uniref:Uncharacterized protein n=1 Tax=Fusarium oligoseptatum TaxID=2604345 RepID=A0A428S9U9_9HYPO|nr:hypothetical protein CEP52_015836 [Fusarium oligoseptatum]
MPKKPASDAPLPPAPAAEAEPASPKAPLPPVKAEPVSPGAPADSEPAQPEHHVWDGQDGSPHPLATNTQAAPVPGYAKPVSGSGDAYHTAENNPWGPPTEPIVVVAKGAVNGFNGFMMAVLALLVTFF